MRTGYASLISILLPIYGVLSYYALPHVSSIGTLLLCVYTFSKIILYRRHLLIIHKPLILFIVYIFISQFIVFTIYGGLNIFRVINILMTIILVIIISVNLYDINFKLLTNTYMIIGIIATVAIFIQFIQIYIFDMHVNQIMLLPLDVPAGWYSGGARPTGFFPEPQAYATYSLLIIIIMLYIKRYFIAILMTLGILCSTSSLGILCVSGIWLWYFTFSYKQSVLTKSLMIMLCLLMLIVLLNLNVFDYTLNKILNINFAEDVRLTRGWWLFCDRPLGAQIFGSGINNIKHLIESGQLVLHDRISSLMGHPEYVTTAYELLIFFGVVGTILYLNVIYDLWQHSSIKILVVLLIILSFGQTILFNNVWVQFMFINYLICRIDNKSFAKVAIEV